MAEVYDVVIIGSGITGALAAVELGKQGKKVLILEAGKDQRGANNRNLFVERFYNATYKTPESAYPTEEACRHARIVDLFPLQPSARYTGYLDQNGSQDEGYWFRSTNERLVGGTTWHWLGTCLRLLESDFKMKTLYNVGEDWPIPYDEMHEWYEKAAAAIGVSGNSEQKLFNLPPLDYPMPMIPESYLDKQYAKAIDGKSVEVGVPGLDGIDYSISSTPQARNSEGFQGRPECCGSTSCIPICPVQAKYDATFHINDAINNYGAVLQSQSVVTDIEADDSGDISRVNYRQWEDKSGNLTYKDGYAEGKYYILAAHAIESPKILLNSTKNPKFKHGIGNTLPDGSQGVVGKYLMDHPCQLSWAESKTPVYPFRGPISTSGIPSLRENPLRGESGAFRIQVGNDAWLWPASAPYQQVYDALQNNTFGKELAESIKEQGIREINLCALIEQKPNPDCTVTLSEQKDALGIPRPRINYYIDEYEKKGLINAAKVHQQVFELLGATNIQKKDPNDFAGAGHMMGTLRMGADPTTSVVDGNQMCHNHKNLMVLGSSTFPTVGTANPTFTIAALALRASQYLLSIMD